MQLQLVETDLADDAADISEEEEIAAAAVAVVGDDKGADIVLESPAVSII